MKASTLMLFNFAVATLFVLFGLVAAYSAGLFQPGRYADASVFGPQARASIEKEENLDELRSRSLFYFDTVRELRRARSLEYESAVSEVRLLCFVAAALFFLSGLGLFLINEADSPPGKRPAQDPA